MPHSQSACTTRGTAALLPCTEPIVSHKGSLGPTGSISGVEAPRFSMTCLRKIQASLLAIILSGCFSVPVAQQAMQVDSADNRSPQSPLCDPATVPNGSATNRGTGLDPERIRVLTWNVHKGGDAGWLTDLEWFGAEHDLVLLKEARHSEPLSRVVSEETIHW